MVIPGTIIGQRYQVIRELGGGGMKRVYLARDQRLDRECAVAEMIDRLGPEQQCAAVAAFEREADMLARLESEHIPRIFDRFSEDNHHYLVTEYVPGQTLEERLSSAGGRLNEALVVDIASQVLDTLTYLHGLSPPVIYRDLKPSNVILRADGLLKMLDFGIARHFEPQKTSTTDGTQGYAPPEQYTGKVERRSDLYALGATLHHLLTGRDPAAAAPFSFPRVLQLCPDTDPRLAELIQTALAYEADQRMPSAREFKRRLNQMRRKFYAEPGIAAPNVSSPSEAESTILAPEPKDERCNQFPIDGSSGEFCNQTACRHCCRPVPAGETTCLHCTWLRCSRMARRSRWIKPLAVIIMPLAALLGAILLPQVQFNGSLLEPFNGWSGHVGKTAFQPPQREWPEPLAAQPATEIVATPTPAVPPISEPSIATLLLTPSSATQMPATNNDEDTLSESVLKRFRGCWYTNNVFQVVDSITHTGTRAISNIHPGTLKFCWSTDADGRTRFHPANNGYMKPATGIKDAAVTSQWSDWIVLSESREPLSVQLEELNTLTLIGGDTEEDVSEYNCQRQGTEIACSRSDTKTMNYLPWSRILSHFRMERVTRPRTERTTRRSVPRKYANRQRRFWPWLASLVHKTGIF